MRVDGGELFGVLFAAAADADKGDAAETMPAPAIERPRNMRREVFMGRVSSSRAVLQPLTFLWLHRASSLARELQNWLAFRRMTAIQILRQIQGPIVAALLLLATAMSTPAQPFPSIEQLPARAGWPEPLVMLDGSKVKSRREWEEKRRPELKLLFQHYMYGSIPSRPARVEFSVQGTYPDFLNGAATLKLISITFGSPDAPRIDLMLVTPNGLKRPAPAFLSMNFCGNHALTADSRVPLARGWQYNSCRGCTNNVATEASRGGQAGDWPMEEIVRRGYALASFAVATSIRIGLIFPMAYINGWLRSPASVRYRSLTPGEVSRRGPGVITGAWIIW